MCFIKNLINNIVKKESFFILVLFFLSISDLYYYIKNQHFTYCVYYISACFISTFIISLIIQYSGKLKKVLQIILCTFLLIYSIINFFCINLIRAPLNNGALALIFATDINEASEFIQTYINPLDVIIISLGIIITIVLNNNKVCNFIRKLGENIPFWMILILLICSLCLTLRNHHVIYELPFGRVITIYNEGIEVPPNLIKYKTNPSFIETSTNHPENIVVIIGESFAKSHSSLYGYNKETNPKLAIHKETGNLHLFYNITSPASHTADAFKAILNTFSYNVDNNIPWYKHTSLPESFNNLGYSTKWISNQNKVGIYDNIPTRFSALCNNRIFIRENTAKECYDEACISYINDSLNYKEITFIHLMGQHQTYKERYPLSYNIFSKNDYIDFPKHQRETLAQYDNATIYNDFVINTIINYFEEKEAIIIYFPDHGHDIYYTDENYCGHGITAIAESDSIGKVIPFMIYTSNLYKKRFPETTQRIIESSHNIFNTENIIFTLLDIAGYSFIDNNNVDSFSLLNRKQKGY